MSRDNSTPHEESQGGVLNLSNQSGNRFVLNLSNCEHIANSDLEHVSIEHPDIWVLNLSHCTNITDDVLEFVAKLPRLRWLYLSYCTNITGRGLKLLQASETLNILDLSGCNSVLVDGGLEHLVQIKPLTILRLTHCNITGESLRQLQGLTRLNELNLSYSNITDEDLKIVNGFPSLGVLILIECKKITDTGIAHLKALENLSVLNLRGCSKITKFGVNTIALQHTRLMSLNLQGCGITDDSDLMILSTVKDLHDLTF